MNCKYMYTLISLSGIMNLHEFVGFVMFECDISLNYLPLLIMKKEGIEKNVKKGVIFTLES